MIEKLKRIKGPIMGGFLVSIICGSIFGYSTAIISPVRGSLQANTAFKPNDIYGSILTASIILGAFFGSITASFSNDRLGRRKSLIAACFIALVANVALICSPYVWMIIICRFFVGVGVGFFSSSGPLYLSECVPEDLRGFLGTSFQFSITFFIFLASFFSFSSKAFIWRVGFGLTLVPIVLLIPLLFSIKDSPRFLMRKGKVSEAREVFLKIYDNNESVVDNHIEDIQKKLAEPKVGLKFFISPENYKAFLIGIWMCVCQQFTGINAIIYFIDGIIKSVLLSGAKSGAPVPPNVTKIVAWATVAIFFWNFITTLIAVQFCDRFGRKKLLFIGTVLMTLSCLGMPLGYYIKNSPKLHLALSICFILIFILGFEIGIGPLFFVVLNELFAVNLRGTVGSIITGILWFFNFVLSISFTSVNDALSGKNGEQTGYVFYIFFVVGFVCCLLILFTLPETKNKSLKEIQMNFVKKKDGYVV